MRKVSKKSQASSLDEAIALTKRYAKEHRLPSKVMADLMGVELKTYYRWLLEGTMPLNRVAQFERLAGCHFVSEYLTIMHGNRVVVEIPRGRKAGVKDIATLQAQVAEGFHLLAKFYADGGGVDETVRALTAILSEIAYQRENVAKTDTPELDFGDDDE